MQIINNVVRSLDTSFQISTVSNTLGMYTMQIQSDLVLTTGEAGTIFMETSNDQVDWIELGRVGNNNSGSLGVGVNVSDLITVQISGWVPRGNYVRLRTSGDATFTYVSGQEVILYT